MLQRASPLWPLQPMLPLSTAPEPSNVTWPVHECIGALFRGSLHRHCFVLPPQATPFGRRFAETTINVNPSKTVRDGNTACSNSSLVPTSDGLIKALGLTNCLTAANSIAIRQHLATTDRTEYHATSKKNHNYIVGGIRHRTESSTYDRCKTFEFEPPARLGRCGRMRQTCVTHFNQSKCRNALGAILKNGRTSFQLKETTQKESADQLTDPSRVSSLFFIARSCGCRRCEHENRM